MQLWSLAVLRARARGWGAWWRGGHGLRGADSAVQMRATAHPSRVPRVPASLARPFVLLVPCHSSGSRSCMAHPTFVIGCPAPAYTGRESESQAPSRIKLCCWSALAKCIARLLACIGINVLGLWSNVVWFARLRSTVVNCLPLLCSYFFSIRVVFDKISFAPQCSVKFYKLFVHCSL